MQPNINQLIKDCKKGRQNAQIQVYDLYARAMFHVARRYLVNHEDAKDAMQEGFLKAFLNINNYKETATFGAWLKRIIINHCIDTHKRRQFVTETLDAKNLEVVDDTDWQFESTITKDEILEAILQLPEKYRIIITLYLVEGYDHEEISEILNINIKTSRTQLRRAKLQLRERLKPKYNEARY